MPKAPGVPIVSDPDAQAFLNAAVITNVTQANAINTLVIALKGYSIWTKFKAIYPIVGGTASQHKFNLKDPRDLDAAFRLTFATGYTHSSNGMLPNGGTAYADTKFNPTTGFTVNDNAHISIYSRTNASTLSVDIGASTAPTDYTLLSIRRSDQSNTSYFAVNSASLITLPSDTSSAAMYLCNRIGTAMTGFRNATNIGTATTTATTRPNFNIVLSAFMLNGTIVNGYYSTKQIAFASIGDGLTNTESANFYTAVQAYQTTLGRQV